MTLLVGVIALIDVSLLYISCTQNQDIAGLKKGNASEDVCPKCSSHDVGKWVYGLVDKKMEDSISIPLNQDTNGLIAYSIGEDFAHITSIEGSRRNGCRNCVARRLFTR